MDKDYATLLAQVIPVVALAGGLELRSVAKAAPATIRKLVKVLSNRKTPGGPEVEGRRPRFLRVLSVTFNQLGPLYAGFTATIAMIFLAPGEDFVLSVARGAPWAPLRFNLLASAKDTSTLDNQINLGIYVVFALPVVDFLASCLMTQARLRRWRGLTWLLSLGVTIAAMAVARCYY